jgi:uncharacterized protein YcbK (DUF882 family)
MGKYFTIEELTKSNTATKLHIDNTPNVSQKKNLEELIQLLEKIREKWKSPIIVTSGFRSPQLNKVVGGSKTSQHLKGEAADIICKYNKELFLLIRKMIMDKEINVGQLINEKNFSWIHISTPHLLHNNQIIAL